MSLPQNVAEPRSSQGRSRRVPWKWILIAFLAIAALLGSWVTSMHLRYRREMEVIALVESHGGSVSIDYPALPEWLWYMQPDSKLPFRQGGLGPNWLREFLGADRLVRYFLVVVSVDSAKGPGLHSRSNFSGKYPGRPNAMITDIELQRIATLRNVVELSLSHALITDIGLRAHGNLRMIQSLNLSFTHITDEAIEVIAGMENLEVLNLAGTQISDDGIAKLKVSRNLQSLDVRETAITNAGLVPLLAEHPGLEIEIDNPDDDLPYKMSL